MVKSSEQDSQDNSLQMKIRQYLISERRLPSKENPNPKVISMRFLPEIQWQPKADFGGIQEDQINLNHNMVRFQQFKNWLREETQMLRHMEQFLSINQEQPYIICIKNSEILHQMVLCLNYVCICIDKECLYQERQNKLIQRRFNKIPNCQDCSQSESQKFQDCIQSKKTKSLQIMIRVQYQQLKYMANKHFNNNIKFNILLADNSKSKFLLVLDIKNVKQLTAWRQYEHLNKQQQKISYQLQLIYNKQMKSVNKYTRISKLIKPKPKSHRFIQI